MSKTVSLALSACVVVLAGCSTATPNVPKLESVAAAATPPVAPPHVAERPHIPATAVFEPAMQGATRNNGKGVPNGRSDAPQPFSTLTGVSSDASYGFSPGNPIRVGDGNMRNGPRNERLYLNALRSYDGHAIDFERRGSCCGFATPNGTMGGGLLDVYVITTPDSPAPVLLYLNMYDSGELIAPQGFTVRPPP